MLTHSSSRRVEVLRSRTVLPVAEQLETRRFCDGSFATAVALGELSGIVTKTGTVDTGANQLDFYKFTTTQPGRLRVSLSKITGGNPDVFLFNAPSSRAVIGSSTQTGTTSELIDKSSLPAGTYYAEVKHATGGSTANYQLSVVTDYAGQEQATARNLGSVGGTAITASDFLGSSDGMDYYKITTTKSGVVNIRVDGLSKPAGTLIQLFDSNSSGQDVGVYVSSIGNAPAQLYHYVASGKTLYFSVVGGDFETSFNYSVHVSIDPLPADNIGNTTATAKNLGTLAGTSPTFTDWIVSPTDKYDYYKLSVAKSGDVRVFITGATDYVVPTILNSRGGTVFSEGLAGYHFVGTTLFHANAGATYYVRLGGATTRPNTASPYSVHFNFAEDLSDNTQATAKAMQLIDGKRVAVGYLAASDTDDWYSVHVKGGDALVVYMEGLTNDADLFLYNSAGKVIGSSSHGLNADEVAATGALTDGTYFVRVKYISGTSIHHLLRVENMFDPI